MPHANGTGNPRQGDLTIRWRQPIYKDGMMRVAFPSAMLKSVRQPDRNDGGARPVAAVTRGPEGRERVLPPGVSFPSPQCVRVQSKYSSSVRTLLLMQIVDGSRSGGFCQGTLHASLI